MKFQILLLSLLLSANGFAAEKTVIRIGVQSGGTVEWELPALQDELNAKQANVQLDIQDHNRGKSGGIEKNNPLHPSVCTR